jgi:hypothetical protein
MSSTNDSKQVLSDLCACENAILAFEKIYDKTREPLTARNSECREILFKYMTNEKLRSAEFDFKTKDDLGQNIVEKLFLRLQDRKTDKSITEKLLQSIIHGLTEQDFVDAMRKKKEAAAAEDDANQEKEKETLGTLLNFVLTSKLQVQLKQDNSLLSISHVADRKGKSVVLPDQYQKICVEWKETKQRLEEERFKAGSQRTELEKEKDRLLKLSEGFIQKMLPPTQAPQQTPQVPQVPQASPPAVDGKENSKESKDPKKPEPPKLTFQYVHPRSHEAQSFVLTKKPMVTKRVPVRFKHTSDLLKPIESWIKTQIPVAEATQPDLLSRLLAPQSEFKQNLFNVLRENLLQMKEKGITREETVSIHKKPTRGGTARN